MELNHSEVSQSQGEERMTPELLDRFLAIRAELFAAIEKALAKDGHCKSYEGAFSIAWPNYFDDHSTDPYDRWAIRLNCYVVGPSRHYEWRGMTFENALEKCESDVRAWIAEAEGQ